MKANKHTPPEAPTSLKATPEWRRAQREARKREEDEYAARCGPVTTKKISDAMASEETP